jgi:hypothetical protein
LRSKKPVGLRVKPQRAKGDDGVDRRPADRVNAADPARQQALATGVEDQPALGVHRGDEHAQGGGQPGQVRDEGQPGRHAVGDADERDEGGRERRGVVVEAGDRGVGQQQVRKGHEGDRQEHARGTLRRGLFVSSASAAEFSQPMNRYTASGKARARPLKWLVRWLGWNGTELRWPPFLISTATDTTSSTTSSKPKKNPASLVDTATPRNIITMAPAVKRAEKMIQGMLTLK